MGATMRFHVANQLPLRYRPFQSEAIVYSLKLGNRRISVGLRTYNGDLFVFHEIFLSKCYWIPPHWLAEGEVKTVVDLGAHLGFTTLFFSQYFPAAHYVCIEPNPANVALLRQNVVALRQNVHVVEGAVGGAASVQQFDTTGASWQGRLIAGQGDGHAVRCLNIPEIQAMTGFSRIDLLKVDIEGAERLLFHSSPDWLKQVKVIVIELHDGYGIDAFQADIAPMGLIAIPARSSYGNQMTCAVAQDVLRNNSSDG
jgi:FkbM family methyltransferase